MSFLNCFNWPPENGGPLGVDHVWLQVNPLGLNYPTAPDMAPDWRFQVQPCPRLPSELRHHLIFLLKCLYYVVGNFVLGVIIFHLVESILLEELRHFRVMVVQRSVLPLRGRWQVHLMQQPIELRVLLLLVHVLRVFIINIFDTWTFGEFPIWFIGVKIFVTVLKVSFTFFNRWVLNFIHHLEALGVKLSFSRQSNSFPSVPFIVPILTDFGGFLSDNDIIIFHGHELVFGREFERFKPLKFIFSDGFVVNVVHNLRPFVR